MVFLQEKGLVPAIDNNKGEVATCFLKKKGTGERGRTAQRQSGRRFGGSLPRRLSV